MKRLETLFNPLSLKDHPKISPFQPTTKKLKYFKIFYFIRGNNNYNYRYKYNLSKIRFIYFDLLFFFYYFLQTQFTFNDKRKVKF